MEKYLKIPEGIKYVCGVAGTVHECCEHDIGRYPRSSVFRGGMYNNEDIEWVYIPDSVEVVGFKAFENCPNLKTVYLPAGLKKIDFNAFLGCPIHDAYYPGSILDFMKIDGTTNNNHSLDFDFLHCKDGTFNHRNEPYYIDAFNFNGTMEQWKKEYGNNWLNRRAGKIVCTDGIIRGCCYDYR